MKCVVCTVAAVAVLAAGCSDVRFGYRQSERVLDWTIASYVALGPRQQQAVSEHLGAVKRWHCATQPPAYAAWVRQAAADFGPGLTTERVIARINGLEYFARLLLTESMPHIATMVRQFTDRQVRELEYNLGHARQLDRARAARLSPHAASGQRSIGMRRSLEYWLGPLTPQQSRLVDTWSGSQQPVDGAVYAIPGLPINAVRRALHRRRDNRVLEDELRALLSAPDRWWTSASDPRLVANRQQTWQMLAAVAAGTGPEQRRLLSERAEALAADLERFGCDPARDATGNN